MEEADAKRNLRSVSPCTAGKAQEADTPATHSQPFLLLLFMMPY